MYVYKYLFIYFVYAFFLSCILENNNAITINFVMIKSCHILKIKHYGGPSKREALLMSTKNFVD